jgi:hypothetical protein
MRQLYTSIIAILVTLTIVGMVTSTLSVQSAQASTARSFAPGIIARVPGSVDESAPKAYDDSSQVGNPDTIGDPDIRAPGLLAQGDR